MASLDDTEDVALDFGSEDNWQRKKSIRYPLAALFHILFKVLAIVFYLVIAGNFIGFIVSFVLLTLLLSMDFWVVKNISGRLLVGLRWWNHVDEDGQSHWVFESRKKGSKLQETNAESRIFWLALILNPVIWFISMFPSFFPFPTGWLFIPIMGLCLGGSNLYGYLRCKIGSRQQLSSFATQFLSQQMFSAAVNSTANQSQGTG
ncbi:Golgi apparatus membrane protein TVP23 homolog B-like [Apostichopus japonicus]|uniref:Golgi apparatus membrane protein TVP23 homolog B-like n=1 Tax=Stichopus japonicus TaxID=307972 RepID=UPI003AB50014